MGHAVYFLSPRYIDAASVFEALHGGTDGRFKLDDSNPTLQGLGVDDDLHVQSVGLYEPLDGVQVHPEVVGVEDVELLHGLEVLDVVLRNLGHFQEPQMILENSHQVKFPSHKSRKQALAKD